jgi:hypothetical protein
MELPNEIKSKIFLFLSHPCADLVKQSAKFRALKLRHDVFSGNITNEQILKYISDLNTAYRTSYDHEYETFYLPFTEDYFNNFKK